MNIDRWSAILSYLESHRETSISELAQVIGVSTSTIRRDMATLQQRHLVTVKNGTVRLSSIDQPLMPDFFTTSSVLLREPINAGAKRDIGAVAASFVHDHDIIFVDASTTVETMIPHIVARDLLIVTNSNRGISLMTSCGFKVYVCSGFIIQGSSGIFDSDRDVLEDKRLTAAFIGACAVDERGFYSSSADARLKRSVLKHSDKVYVLADSSKYSCTSFVNFAHPDQVTLITNERPPFPGYEHCIVAQKDDKRQ